MASRRTTHRVHREPWRVRWPRGATVGCAVASGCQITQGHLGSNWVAVPLNAVETKLDVSSGAGPGENWSAPRGKWSFPTTCRQAGSGHSAPPLPFVPFLLAPGRPRCLSGAGILGGVPAFSSPWPSPVCQFVSSSGGVSPQAFRSCLVTQNDSRERWRVGQGG